MNPNPLAFLYVQQLAPATLAVMDGQMQWKEVRAVVISADRSLSERAARLDMEARCKRSGGTYRVLDGQTRRVLFTVTDDPNIAQQKWLLDPDPGAIKGPRGAR